MGLDNTKERLEQQSKSYKADAARGIARGFMATGVAKTVFKSINFGGKIHKIRVPHGKLGLALSALSRALALKSLYHQTKAASASDTPIGTFLKIGFVGSLASAAGGIGGALAGRGAVAAAQKLRSGSMAFARTRAFARATVVSSANVSTKTGKPAGNFIFRRVRIHGRVRIIPIRVHSLPGGKNA